MDKLISLPIILLIIAISLVLLLLIYVLHKKGKAQLQKAFCFDLLCVLIICTGVLLQSILCKNFDIDPIEFEKYIYIGTCFLPVCIYFTGLIFENTKLKFKNYYALLFIVPIVSLLVLWTNDKHHLFYRHYSTNINDGVPGPYMYIHNFYTYLLLLLGVIHMLKASLRNSGFFSKQSLLIVLGICIPVVTNLLGTLKIIPMTVFVTPISCAFAMVCFALAIFKFEFLGIAPIALQTIVNQISDSYVVLNENFIITDFNATLLKVFNLKDKDIRNQNIIDFLKSHKKYSINVQKLEKALNTVKNSHKALTFEQYFNKQNKYFTVEVNTIYNKDSFLGILLLLKDITQHKLDMQTIQNNQDMLMEKERLASLGQLIGGISHNLKTPIMSISGAAEGLSDLIQEYDASIGDPEVTQEDHHAIASDMREWIDKIHSYTSYMSDIITAVKGQAVALSENENDIFTIDELLKRVNILMKHEIQNASLKLNIKLDVPSSTSLKGDVNSLVQVVNNLITNAIQSYNGTKNENIDLVVKQISDNLIISITDHGCGIPSDVQSKLFKSMVTTKGKNGTGLGMFMSYSTIKGHFNGDMTFSTEVGKGTTFNILLPLLKS